MLSRQHRNSSSRAVSRVERWILSRSLTFCLAGAATAFSGCAYTGGVKEYIHNGFKVGPNYAKPAAPVATQWMDDYDEQIKDELPNYADWWTTFNDPKLNSLMEEVSQQNLTLKSAGLRVLQARYVRAIAVGSIFPQKQTGSGSYQRTQYSETIAAGLLPRNTDLFRVGFDSFWELDAWGRFRRGIESADASLDETVEDYDAMLVSLLGETATAYIDLRTAQERIRFAKANEKIQQGSLELAKARFTAGAVSKLDFTQSETVLANTQQLIPLFESQIRAANNSLCVLLGIPPRDLTEELGDGFIPDLPADLVVGIPANLLRRRPDVRAAERRVAAQSAVIGIAAADLLPHLSVTGSISLVANDFSQLFKSGSSAGTIAPGFNWDILNYGRLANNVNLQEALFQDLAVQYQQQVLDANAEVETAINSFLKSKVRLIYVGKAVDASQESVDLAQIQYKTGAVDYNRVFNLQTSLVSDQDNLAVVRGDVARSVVATYKALGGGWEIRNGIRRGAGASNIEQVPVPPVEQVDPVPGEDPNPPSGAAKPKAANGAEDAVLPALQPEANAPEANAPEADVPEANVPEANVPEANAPEANAPEANAPEADAPEAPAQDANGQGVNFRKVLLPEVRVEEL
ncbi:MAG: efflux transporter outer membrane subunit [Rubripirellula sp.]|nr:efflux transporter outer membrane subunit [Rubripirellula sp.]